MSSPLKKIGKILFKLTPASWMPSVTKLSLEIELRKQFARLKRGTVLDIGGRDAPYKPLIPHTKYMVIDVNPDNKPDICCDVNDIKWESDYFDTVVTTEMLEHLNDPQRAINEMRRVLKKGGTIICTTRFIFPYHPDHEDHYRYTWDSLNYLFREFSTVEVHSHGNAVQSAWQIINQPPLGDRRALLINIFLNIFNPLIARINFKETRNPLGFVVYAKK